MVSVPSKVWMAPRPAMGLTTRWSSSGQPHPLAAGPFCAGQPAAIGVPHGSGIARCAGRHQSQSPQLKIFLGGERPVAR